MQQLSRRTFLEFASLASAGLMYREFPRLCRGLEFLHFLKRRQPEPVLDR